MIFQAIDDKTECIGIYHQGMLYYDNFPEGLHKTWSYTGSLENKEIEFGYLYALGQSLEDAAPTQLREPLIKANKRLKAYLKSFQLHLDQTYNY